MLEFSGIVEIGQKTMSIVKYLQTKYIIASIFFILLFCNILVYLLLGMVLMSLTLTVFYDIPQLNLGFNLHTYSDIRLPTKNTTGYKDDTISTSTTITSVSQKWTQIKIPKWWNKNISN